MSERSVPVGARQYEVYCGHYEGHGPTPCLALRDFWRGIEVAALAGRVAPVHLLPRRVQRRIQLRAEAPRG